MHTAHQQSFVEALVCSCMTEICAHLDFFMAVPNDTTEYLLLTGRKQRVCLFVVDMLETSVWS